MPLAPYLSRYKPLRPLIPAGALSPMGDASDLSYNPDLATWGSGDDDVSSSGVTGIGDSTQPDAPPTSPRRAMLPAMPPPTPQPPPEETLAPPMAPPSEPQAATPPRPQLVPRGPAAPPPTDEDTGAPVGNLQYPGAAAAGAGSAVARPQSDFEQKRQALEQERTDLQAKRPVYKSNVAQDIAMAILSSGRLAGVANQIAHPKFTQQMNAYNSAVGDISEREKELEQLETAGAQAEMRRATADQREREKAREDYITVPGGGLFDTKAKTWIRQPADKSQLTQISEDQGKRLGIQPLEDGTYAIPHSAVDSLINSQKIPEIKTIEEAILHAQNDATLTPELRQAKINDLVKAHNLLHPTTPIHGIETDAKGNSTLVVADPSDPTKVQKIPLGAIGKPQPPQSPAISLTPEAVDYWANAASRGIPLPSMGMGASGATARQQIINAAPGAAAASGVGSLAEAKTNLKADSGSQAAMQKMLDAVTAYEKTAGANLDIFLKTAKNVVDSGSPWINTPLRAVTKSGFGSADTAAYDAARQVALTEISKVINNPNLTGQLSDSARKEVMGLDPENATLGQIYAVAKVLKQDMANRHQYLKEGVSEIQGRIKGGGKDQSGGGTGKVVVKGGDGSLHPFDTEEQAKAFEALVASKGGTTSRQ